MELRVAALTNQPKELVELPSRADMERSAIKEVEDAVGRGAPARLSSDRDDGGHVALPGAHRRSPPDVISIDRQGPAHP